MLVCLFEAREKPFGKGSLIIRETKSQNSKNKLELNISKN